MALSSGTRLGPYEIVTPLGVGGMGEVYKARDTRLDRTVAVKVLPGHVASDAQLKQRFEREAKALAALKHPHICDIYDVGSQDGIDFLVMEHLEGETLAQRLTKGALPLDQALQVAIQIAAGLDKAHRTGIVHRDLKTGNIMLTKAGGAAQAKLLDFGLAKLRPMTTAGGIALSQAPTVSAPLGAAPGEPLTGAGTILGTFQYMAPEQLEGHEADARTDIFAFGAVVYEMVTGKKAFEGTSQASLIGAILHTDPAPMSSLQPVSPSALDRVVKKCLAKSADDRWQTVRDLLDEIRWVQATPAIAVLPVVQSRRTRFRVAAFGVAAGVAAIAGAFLLSERTLRTTSPEPAFRLEVSATPTDEPVSFAISPDGRQLVYSSTADGVSKLWLRPLEGTKAQPLPGTEQARYPFWSPDSRAIAFTAGGKLKRLDLPDGTPQDLADAPSGRGGAWGEDGVILFTPTGTQAGLMRVAAASGTPTMATEGVPVGASDRFPSFLPGGRRFLFRRGNHIHLGTLDSLETRELVEADSDAAFVPPASILFMRQTGLWMAAFDPASEIVGAPRLVVSDVAWDANFYKGGFSVSMTGMLTYRLAGSRRTRLVWLDRVGRLLAPVEGSGELEPLFPELSPDGRQVAVQHKGKSDVEDVWLVGAAAGGPSRLTNGGGNWPMWAPDGRKIVFTRNQNTILERAMDGGGLERHVLSATNRVVPLQVSVGGGMLLYQEETAGGWDLRVLSLRDRDTTPVAVTEGGLARGGQWSPDGRWIAYLSEETGREEVYVRRFPGNGQVWRVSPSGGAQPRWRRDGRELFFMAADGQLSVSAFDGQGESPIIGAPESLFRTRMPQVGAKAQYAVSADGQQFLVNTVVDADAPIIVVPHWSASLDR